MTSNPDGTLMLPTPTASDANRHTTRSCWKPGENWRGVSLNNAILDAGEITMLPTPASSRWMICDGRDPDTLKNNGHTPQLNDIIHGEIHYLPTPMSRDSHGANQRNTPDCLPVAVQQAAHTPVASPARPEWGLDDGTGVDYGRFTAAIRRWERVLGRPAPCPTQATGGLRRWIAAHDNDPEITDPRWLARHAPQDDSHPRVDGIIRRRVLRRLLAADRGRMLYDNAFWRAAKGVGEDTPIPATRLPDPCVLRYWRDKDKGARFPTAAHLSPRFVEWMMGLDDGWVTDPDIWRGVNGNHRNLQLRALGNGVVPLQAATAIDWSLRLRERLAAGV